MCRSLSSRVVLSYALQAKQTVTTDELQKKRGDLIESLGDVLADVSFVSLHSVVQASEGMLRLDVDGGGYKISRTRDWMRSVSTQKGLLPESYLKAYVGSTFTPKERSEIERVLKA